MSEKSTKWVFTITIFLQMLAVILTALTENPEYLVITVFSVGMVFIAVIWEI